MTLPFHTISLRKATCLTLPAAAFGTLAFLVVLHTLPTDKKMKGPPLPAAWLEG